MAETVGKGWEKKTYSNFGKKYYAILIPLFLILGMAVSGAVGYIDIVSDTKQNTEAVLIDSAYEQVVILHTKIDSQLSVLKFVASSIPDNEELIGSRVSQLMMSAVKNSEFDNMAVVLPNGAVYAESGLLSKIKISSEHVRMAMTGELSVGCCLEKDDSGKSYILLFQPILGKNGAVRGVLCGFYSAQRLAESVISEAYGERAYSYIADSKGNIIIDTAHRDYILSLKNSEIGHTNDLISLYQQSEIRGTNLADIKSAMELGSEKSFYFTFHNMERYTAFVPTDINGWLLFNTVNGSVIRESISEAVDSMLARLLLLLGFAVAAVIYTIWRERLVLKTLEAEKEELMLSRQEYKVAVAQSNRSIFRFDIKTASAKFSYAASEFFCTDEEIKNIPETLIENGHVAPESAAEHRRFYNSIMSGSMQETCDVKVRESNGSYSWHRLNSTLITDSSGTPAYAVISSADVTKQKEQALAYERWRRSFASLSVDKSMVVEYNMTDDVCENICGELPVEFKGMPKKGFDSITAYYVNSSIYHEDVNKFTLFMNHCRLISDFCGGKSEESMEFRIKRHGKPDDFMWISVSVHMVRCPDTECIKAVIVFKDIHEEKIEKLELEARSKQDPLTGMLNRKAFEEEANLLLKLEHASSHVFMMIDIDNFKLINDSFGHIVGDNAIISVAQMFKSVLRVGDLAGRMGGDEFMVVLKNIPFGEVVERRAEIVRQMMHIKINELRYISGSIGVALYPKDGKSFEELYAHADIALYKAKESGGDRYVFYDESISASAAHFKTTPIDSPSSDGTV